MSFSGMHIDPDTERSRIICFFASMETSKCFTNIRVTIRKMKATKYWNKKEGQEMGV